MSKELDYLQNIAKEDLADSLWEEYTKCLDYEPGILVISQKHPLVREREDAGLKTIYCDYVDVLKNEENAFEKIKSLGRNDWIEQWKEMNCKLFENVFKECGNWRKTNKTFGQIYENPHNIPDWRFVPTEMVNYAENVKFWVSLKLNSLDEKCRILAKVHYNFIKIHPFPDGNGRIARAITDQISLCLNLPAAMNGYPRHNPEKRVEYHNAINACAKDPDCTDLAKWIKGYIDAIQNEIIG